MNLMSEPISRRNFAATAGLVVASASQLPAADEPPQARKGPVEAEFERDYPEPQFQPSWKRPQINRQLVQDYVIYAHMDLDMVKKLLTKEPGLVYASINWGADDWESGLNAAAHMGRRDLVEYQLAHGARIDIFCAAMLGMLDVVKAFLTLEPKLIDSKGPHGFTLHFHAQVGGKEAEPVLEYLQTVKKIEMKPNPFLQKKDNPPKKKSS
jgi:hypothetical protein